MSFLGGCGTNTETKLVWGQGLGPTPADALKDAKADFETELKKESDLLAEWAKDLDCPSACGYKIVTALAKQDYHVSPARLNETKHAFVVDITQTLQWTVYCVPFKHKD